MSDQKSRNIRVAELLQECGDSLETPRRVQHWAYFPTTESRAKFMALLGIRFELIEPFENTCPGSSAGKYAVRFWHVGLPDGDSMSRVTTLLAGYARDCSGAYDGWETQVLS